MIHCNAPHCFRTKNQKCITPNPWIVFLQSIKGQKMDPKERRRKYDQFLEKYHTVKLTGDNAAYRGALCLRRQHTRAPVKVNKIGNFANRLMSERDDIVMECNMTPELVNFFSKFVPTKIDGSNLNPCQVIAKNLLKACVSRDQLKYFTFQKNIAVGGSGVVFSGTYKRQEVIVKIAMVSGTHDHVHILIPPDIDTTVRTMQEETVRREFNVHKYVHGHIDASTPFRVPEVYGKLAVVNRKIAVFVMEHVKNKHISFRDVVKSNHVLNEISDRYKIIPSIIHQFHKWNITHNDLHVNNVLFWEDERPVVIDFGRCVVLNTIENEQDRIILQLVDYVVPLWIVLSKRNYPRQITQILRFYTHQLHKEPIRTELSDLKRRLRNNNNIQERFNSIINVNTHRDMTRQEIRNSLHELEQLTRLPLFSGARNFFQIAVL